ncbi:MAG: translocation/assembly module TamB domain-containing protein [Pseudomonadota bacterium]
MRAVKLLLWTLGALVVLTLLARIALATGPGRALAASQIEALDVSGQSLEVDGLRGDLGGRFQIALVEVADADGVWLRVRDLDAAWRPFALVGGAARADFIEIGAVEVLREPVLADAPAEADEGGGSFVDRFEIRRFSVGSLTLAEGVAGPKAAFSLAGGLDVGGDAGMFGLDLAPADGAGDVAIIEARWGGDRVLDALVEVRAPAGGVLAELAELGVAEDVTVRFQGAGGRDDWRADGAAVLGEAVFAEVEASRDGETARASASLDVAAIPRFADLAARLGGPLDIAADVDLSDASVMAISGTASAPALTAAVDFGVDPAAPAAPTELDFRLESPDPGALLGTQDSQLSGLEIEGRATRVDDGWRIAGEAEATDLAQSGWEAERLAGPISAALSGAEARLQIDVSAEGLSGPVEALAEALGAAPALRAAASYDLEEGRLSLGSTRLTGAALTLEAAGDVRLDDLTGELSGRLRTEAPAVTDTRVYLQLLGGGALSAALESAGDSPQLAELLGAGDGAFEAEARLGLSDAGALEIETATLIAGDLRANAAGRADPSGAVDLTGAISGLTLSRPEFAVADLDLTWTAKGPAEAIVIEFGGAADSVRSDDIALNALTADGRYETRDGSGALALTGEAAGAPLSLATDFVAADAWRLDGLTGAWGDLRLAGTASGRGGEAAALRADVVLEGAPPIDMADAVAVRAVLDGALVDIDAQVEGLTGFGLSSAAGRASIRGPLEDLAVSGGLAGRADFAAGAPAALEVAGRLAGLTSGEVSGDLNASGGLGALAFETDGPLVFAAGAVGWEARGALAALGGSAEFDATSDDEGVAIDAVLRELALSDVSTFLLGREVAGAASADLQLAGRGVELAGTAELLLTDLAADRDGAEPMDLAVSARLAAGRLLVEATAPRGPLELDARVEAPVIASAKPFRLALAENANADVSLIARGDVAPLLAAVLPETIRAGGELDAALSQAWPAGDLQGSARLEGGAIEHADLGLTLRDLSIDTVFANGVATIDRISGGDGDGGVFQGAGQVSLAGDGLGEVALSFAEFEAVRRREAQATVSGDLDVARGEGGLAITGDLVVNRADIQIGGMTRSTRPTVAVRFPEDPPPPERAGAGGDSTVDIKISAQNQVFVEGLGLDAEFAFDAEITGALDAPDIVGAARIVRGDYALAGQRFDFDRESRVDLNGDPQEARLNITARREQEALDVIVNITGTPARPVIALSSEPEFPEDEVLSRLLFGRSPAELSALEAARLAAALASLARGGGGGGVLSGLEGALAIDRIDIRETEGGSAEITTGKYLSEDVYLEFRTTPEGESNLAIEWEVFDNVEVGAEQTAEAGPRFSVRWRRDFD